MAGFDINDYLVKDTHKSVDEERELVLMQLETTHFTRVAHDELRGRLEDLRNAYRTVVEDGWTADRRAWCADATKNLNKTMARLRAKPDDVPGMEAFLKLELQVLTLNISHTQQARWPEKKDTAPPQGGNLPY